MLSYETKCEKLRHLMGKYSKEDIAVAYSGGVDSGLLLKMACKNAEAENRKVYAITMQTGLHPAGEAEQAMKTAAEAGAEHLVIQVDEMSEAGILDNPPDRCYRCKKYLFQKLKEKAEGLGVHTILEGTNEDDMHGYRPGIQAVRELGIKSPLAEAGLTKADVRRLAEQYHISTARKPSTPCLATRFPYGTTLTPEKLQRVEKGEEFLKTLGVYNIRLRVHGDIVRIEVDGEDMEKILEHREKITDHLKSLGYSYITMDIGGFRSGSMDKKLEHHYSGLQEPAGEGEIVLI